MRRARLTSKISYRLSEERRRQIEEEAEEEGVSANDWCRAAAIEKLDKLRGVVGKNRSAKGGNGTGMVVNERALLEQIARLGYLIEHGFGIQLAADKATDAEWVRRLKESKAAAARLVEMMLEQRSEAGMG